MISRIRCPRTRSGVPHPRTLPTVRGLATALAALALAGTACGSAAAAAPETVQPQTVPGPVFHGGADGTPRTVMCPPEENAMGGGFALSAPDGRQLGHAPADLLESRPTADATGWIVAVRKDLATGSDSTGSTDSEQVLPGGPMQPGHHAAADPADLTAYVVCTQGENTPGG